MSQNTESVDASPLNAISLTRQKFEAISIQNSNQPNPPSKSPKPPPSLALPPREDAVALKPGSTLPRDVSPKKPIVPPKPAKISSQPSDVIQRSSQEIVPYNPIGVSGNPDVILPDQVVEPEDALIVPFTSDHYSASFLCYNSKESQEIIRQIAMDMSKETTTTQLSPILVEFAREAFAGIAKIGLSSYLDNGNVWSIVGSSNLVQGLRKGTMAMHNAKDGLGQLGSVYSKIDGTIVGNLRWKQLHPNVIVNLGSQAIQLLQVVLLSHTLNVISKQLSVLGKKIDKIFDRIAISNQAEIFGALGDVQTVIDQFETTGVFSGLMENTLSLADSKLNQKEIEANLLIKHFEDLVGVQQRIGDPVARAKEIKDLLKIHANDYRRDLQNRITIITGRTLSIQAHLYHDIQHNPRAVDFHKKQLQECRNRLEQARKHVSIIEDVIPDLKSSAKSMGPLDRLMGEFDEAMYLCDHFGTSKHAKAPKSTPTLLMWRDEKGEHAYVVNNSSAQSFVEENDDADDEARSIFLDGLRTDKPNVPVKSVGLTVAYQLFRTTEITPLGISDFDWCPSSAQVAKACDVSKERFARLNLPDISGNPHHHASFHIAAIRLAKMFDRNVPKASETTLDENGYGSIIRCAQTLRSLGFGVRERSWNYSHESGYMQTIRSELRERRPILVHVLATESEKMFFVLIVGYKLNSDESQDKFAIFDTYGLFEADETKILGVTHNPWIGYDRARLLILDPTNSSE